MMRVGHYGDSSGWLAGRDLCARPLLTLDARLACREDTVRPADFPFKSAPLSKAHHHYRSSPLTTAEVVPCSARADVIIRGNRPQPLIRCGNPHVDRWRFMKVCHCDHCGQLVFFVLSAPAIDKLLSSTPW